MGEPPDEGRKPEALKAGKVQGCHGGAQDRGVAAGGPEEA